MASSILQSILKSGYFEDLVDIEILETIESTAATITRFKLFSKTTTHHLIFKDFRANWIGGGNAELAWYTKFASSIKPGISPTFYGGEIDRQTQHCHLILDDLSATHRKLSDSKPIATNQTYLLEQVIETMLHLHISWWDHPSLQDHALTSPQGGPLRLAHASSATIIKNYVQALQEAFPKNVAELEPAISASDISICEQAIESWTQIFISRVEQGEDLTLIHGDFHIWNLFFPHDQQSAPLLIVDWETYKRGIRVYDLAYLLITCLDTQNRSEIEKALLKKYHNGLVAGGIRKYSWQDCIQDYRLAIIANLFPPLMWKSGAALAQAIAAYKDWEWQELLP